MPSGEPFLIIRKSSYGAPGIPSKPREKVMKRHNHDVNLPNREWRGELFRSRHIITDVASGISTKTYVDILPEFSLHIRDRRGCTYHATSGRSDEASDGNDVISVATRLRDWRDVESKGQTESQIKYVSPPIARVVKQSVPRRFVRSIRTRLDRTRLDTSTRLPVVSSLSLVLSVSIMSERARKMDEGRKGGFETKGFFSAAFSFLFLEGNFNG